MRAACRVSAPRLLPPLPGMAPFAGVRIAGAGGFAAATRGRHPQARHRFQPRVTPTQTMPPPQPRAGRSAWLPALCFACSLFARLLTRPPLALHAPPTAPLPCVLLVCDTAAAPRFAPRGVPMSLKRLCKPPLPAPSVAPGSEGRLCRGRVQTTRGFLCNILLGGVASR